MKLGYSNQFLLRFLVFKVEFLIKRLPYGKTFYFERNVQGKMLGLTRRKGKNEVNTVTTVISFENFCFYVIFYTDN